MKVHLIDGTYELFRAFYGAPPALSPAGHEVGAARGLLRSLGSLLRDPECTHVAIAFDHVIESFRNDLFSGYKTGEGMDSDLEAQFPLAERVATALGLTVWPMVEFEADDALATAAMRWSRTPSVDQVVICSPDKDLAQCVEGDRVILWDRMRDRIFDEAGVVEKWGVPPASIPDLLALMGDSADGIPGIPRWGLKSSSKLLAEYGQIESIPLESESWSIKVRGASGLAQNLSAGIRDALLYKTLATLRQDVPIEESLSDLRWRGGRREEMRILSEELGDPSALDRITEWR